jgi:hypothetical protein
MADDPPLYWSAAQTEQFVKALNESEKFQKAARKFDDQVVFRCLDTPEGEDAHVTYTIRNGQVSADRWTEPAPSSAIRNAPFDKKKVFARTTAPYAVWVKLDKGEMNVLQALRSPDYQVEGPMLKIMSNIGVFNAMSDVASSMPKRYE